MNLKRTLALGLTGAAVSSICLLHAQEPRVRLERPEVGPLRISASGDTNRMVLEQADSLLPADWQAAQISPGGLINGLEPMRVFRLRALPELPEPANALQLGALSFEDSAPHARVGEAVQFKISAAGGGDLEARWFVNGIEGGQGNLGFIDALGRFTGPALPPPNRFVEIRAEVISANGDRSSAQTILEIDPPAGIEPAVPILAAAGGAVESRDGRNILEIPPGALQQDTIMGIEPSALERLEALNADDDAAFDVVAMAELTPRGSVFNAPVSVKLHLAQSLPPGTKLAVEIEEVTGQGSVWQPAGMEAEVDVDGASATFQTPHFSTFRMIITRTPTINLGPTVNAVLPAEMLEGQLFPILLRGVNFSPSMRVTTQRAQPAGPAPLLKVISVAYDPASPNELGVLLKSLPDSTLSRGATRAYTLRISPLRGAAATVNFTVRGLDEFVVRPGVTLDLSASPTPPERHLLFSRIEIGAGATLRSRSAELDWQATDSVEIQGQIIARGQNGADGSFGAGGAAGGGVLGGGAGGSIANGVLVSHASSGSPALIPSFGDFLPGTLGAQYGQGGETGFDPGSGNYADALNAVSEQMYGLYASEINSRHRDPFDFTFWLNVSEELTLEHPEGRKGQQGNPGGFVPSAPRSGFYIGSRKIQQGGGGGGGGASYRPNRIDQASGHIRAGLGGGAGGGGGGAITFVAGGEMVIGPSALADTSGGNGGNGAAPLAADFPNAAPLGRGAGGGPGGAGTIHLLAGERLIGGNGPPFINTAGSWGAGGFLMLLSSHRQAMPPSWMEPMAGTPSRSQGEVSGPDFWNHPTSLQTRIQTGRALEAVARNPYLQSSEVTVSNDQGSRTFRLTGRSAGQRRVRILLKPGTNHVSIASAPDLAVLNRDIVVLATPDSDGDGLSNEEESRLGYDAARADSDNDGINDAEEWLAGGNSAPGDTDGDGVPDAVELFFITDPNDPNSTPFNTHLALGQAIATPAIVNVVRPAFGSANGVPPSMALANPADVRIVRPAFGAANGIVPGFVLAAPSNVRVARPAIGAANGIPFNIIFAQPESIVVRRP